MPQQDSGNLTLVIDADTGRAIAKLAGMANGMDSIKKKTHEAGDAAKESGKKFEEMAHHVGRDLLREVGLGHVALGAGIGSFAATLGIGLITNVYEHFKQKAEQAKQLFEKTIQDADKTTKAAGSVTGISSRTAGEISEKLHGRISPEQVAKIGGGLLRADPAMQFKGTFEKGISTVVDMNPAGEGVEDLVGQLSRLGIDPEHAKELVKVYDNNNPKAIAEYAKTHFRNAKGKNVNDMLAQLSKYAGNLTITSPEKAGRGLGHMSEKDKHDSLRDLRMMGAVPDVLDVQGLHTREENESQFKENSLERKRILKQGNERSILLNKVLKQYPGFTSSKYASNFNEDEIKSADDTMFKSHLYEVLQPYIESQSKTFSQSKAEIDRLWHMIFTSTQSIDRAATHRSNQYEVDSK